MSASTEVLIQEDSISYLKIKTGGEREMSWNAHCYLRNELVDLLYHHIPTEAPLTQLLLGHVVELMLSGKVVDSVSSFMRPLMWGGSPGFPGPSGEDAQGRGSYRLKGPEEGKVVRPRFSSQDPLYWKAGEEVKALQDMRTNLVLANPCCSCAVESLACSAVTE